MSLPLRHHYVPRFYLKAWLGPDGKIPTWFENSKGNITFKRYSTKSVCFRDQLYSVNLNRSSVNIEKDYYNSHDNFFSKSINNIIAGRSEIEMEKEFLANFVSKLIYRNESILNRIQSAIQKDNEFKSDTSKLDSNSGFKIAKLMSLKVHLDASEEIEKFIKLMKWQIIETEGILTSDRPVVFLGPISKDDGGFLLPISDKRIIIVHNFRHNIVSEFKEKSYIGRINSLICKNSTRFVFGNCSERFINKNWPRTP